jgi:hypothetical protein
MQKLTAEQAFYNVSQAVHAFKGSRQEHEILDQSLLVLKSAIVKEIEVAE